MSRKLRLGIYAAGVAVVAALVIASLVTGTHFRWVYAAVAALLLFVMRPSSSLHRWTTAHFGKAKIACTVLVALITVTACVLPMGELPLWNGEDAGHRNQYEVMAESILDGHIDMYYDEEDTLAQLENPYDPAQREGHYYHWDHAYYEGHYYMYFGVVPVFLAFLPYRLLTGEPLTTYHATQLFVAVFIAGVFVLFRLLSRLFFKKLPFTVYLSLSVAVSAMSVWYASAEPALYCTAITAALALQIWSLYFFIKAVWGETRENRQIVLAGVGAVLGALVFGCRPPIALANLLVIPILVTFLRQRKFSLKLLGKLVLAALPYALVAACLMWYNNARFDSPFEFGQAYQLTVADQTAYTVRLNKDTLLRVANSFLRVFMYEGGWKEKFPYVTTSGVLWNFPLIWLGLGLFRAPSLGKLRQDKTLALSLGLPLTVVGIAAIDIMWTPYWLERYNMDMYFLLGIALFLAVGYWYATCGARGRKWLSFAVVAMAGSTVVSAFLLYAYTVGLYYPAHQSLIAYTWRLL